MQSATNSGCIITLIRIAFADEHVRCTGLWAYATIKHDRGTEGICQHTDVMTDIMISSHGYIKTQAG